MTDKKTQKPLLVLETDIGEIEFSDTEAVRNWYQKEHGAFSWMANISKQDGNAGQAWSTINSWLNQLNQFAHNYDRPQNAQQRQVLIANVIKQAEQAFKVQKVKSSESEVAQFIFDLKKSVDPTVAAYALSFLMRQTGNFNTASALEGAFWALQYEKGSTETVEAQQKALEALKRSWSTRFGKLHKELREKNDGLAAEVSDLRDEFLSLKNGMTEQLGSQKGEFDQLVEQARQQLEKIERTYDEKLALQSSVKYWGGKRKHHQGVMWWMAGVTALFSVLSGIGFVWAAIELLQETMGQVPLWKLGVMLAISSFGVWITRLSAKIFISNLHLRADADERVTMIQTYLALLRDGSGPKEDERQLILQTLFRPSSSGFIKEEGPAGFYEAMSRLTGK